MARELTAQEKLFLERMATYLIDAGKVDAASIEAAGEQVLADDRRIVSKICGNDDFRHEAGRFMAKKVHDAVAAL